MRGCRGWLIGIVLVLASLGFTCDTAPANPNHHVSLAWGYIGTGANFKVYRSTNGLSYIVVGQTNQITYTDNKVLRNHTYWYSVSAVNNGLESGRSNVVKATIP